jgi:FMN phosphatase YigB (HAD superfamily)
MPSTGVPVPASVPIEGVIFDLHHTLVDPGEPARWLDLAWRYLDRPGDPGQILEAGRLREIYDVLDRVWDLAREVDPSSTRDLDPEAHERVFHTVLGRMPELDRALVAALYATLPDVWWPYEDALPVLQALHHLGRPVAVLSNVGFDVRPMLERTGIAGLIAGTALSYEVGAVKPDRAIFDRGLELIGVPASDALMVGDNFADDGAAAALGIRTLILPRTTGRGHGLDAVLRLVAEAPAQARALSGAG